MRATILTLALLATPALADWRESCATIGELAETVMESRQKGVSLSDMMGVVSDEARSLAEPMIIEAYDHPRYSTAKVKRRTIEDFRDRWYLACARQLRD